MTAGIEGRKSKKNGSKSLFISASLFDCRINVCREKALLIHTTIDFVWANFNFKAFQDTQKMLCLSFLLLGITRGMRFANIPTVHKETSNRTFLRQFTLKVMQVNNVQYTE